MVQEDVVCRILAVVERGGSLLRFFLSQRDGGGVRSRRVGEAVAPKEPVCYSYKIKNNRVEDLVLPIFRSLAPASHPSTGAGRGSLGLLRL